MYPNRKRYAAALFFHDRQHGLLGSWANTMKLTPGYAFPLFYWDYLVGMVLGALVLGFTLGSFGGAGLSFLADLRGADTGHILYALARGDYFQRGKPAPGGGYRKSRACGGLSDRHRIGARRGRADELLIFPAWEPVPVVQRIVLVVLAIIF